MMSRQSVEQMLGPQANFQKLELAFSNDDLGIKIQSDLHQFETKEKDLLNSETHKDKCKTTQPQLDNTFFLNKTLEQLAPAPQLQQQYQKNQYLSQDVEQYKSETQRAQNNEEQISSNILFTAEKKRFSISKNLFQNKQRESTQTPKEFQQEDSEKIRKASQQIKKQKAERMNQFQRNFVKNSKNKMMYFLQKLTPFGRNKSLKNEKIIQFIDDKSCSYQNQDVNYEKANIQNLICKVTRQIIIIFNSRSFLINPLNQFYLIALSAFSFFNLTFCILLSIFLVFIQANSIENSYSTATFVIWILEIVLHLNSSIFDSSKFISERIQILFIYIKNRAIFDIIPIIIIFASEYIQSAKSNLIMCLCFLKLKNTFYDIEFLNKALRIYSKRQCLLKIIALTFSIFLFSHIIASLWYLIGQIEIHTLNLNETWYSHLDSQDQTWWKIYLCSLNWSITALVTGNNQVSTPLQRVFANIIMIFSFIFFGYILNQIYLIMNQNQQNRMHLIDNSIKINQYMNRIQTSHITQMKANAQLEKFHQHFQNKNNDEAQIILKQLSLETFKEIKLEYFLKIIKNISILHTKFSNETLNELIDAIQEDCFGTEQIIISQKEQQQPSLIYVVEGELEVFQHFQKNGVNQKSIQTLKSGEFFGQFNFFTGQICQISIKTKMPTKIVRFSREKFIEIIKNKKNDFEVFCDIRDKISLNENYELIGQSCVFCQSSIHLFVECPLIHLPKRLIYYSKKFEQNLKQSRLIHNRRKLKQNSLYKLQQNQTKADIFIKNFKMELKENTDMKKNLGLYLLYNLSLEDLSSEIEKMSAKEPSFIEESKEENQKFMQKISQKRISQNLQDIHRTQTQNSSSSGSQQMDNIDSLLNNFDDLKILSQKSAQTISYNNKYQLQAQSQKNRLSTSQQIYEDEHSHKKNTNVQLPGISSFSNNLEPENISDLIKTTSLGNKFTKPNSIPEFSTNVSKSLDLIDNDKFQQKELDLNSISKYLVAKKSVFFSLQENNNEFDKLRNYQFYFPSGNSNIIFKKYLRYQQKLFQKSNL